MTTAEGTMIERVARAIDRVVYGALARSWEAAGEKPASMRAARVAIEALREPSPEMIAAAWGAWHSRHGGKLGPGPAFVEAIKAAIDAILNEEPRT